MNISVFNLTNKIKVIFDKTNGAEILNIKVFVGVGSACENEKNSGLSSLTLSSMMRSTLLKNSESLDGAIDDLGASLSGVTSHDYSFISMALLSKHCKNACEILAEIITKPAFDNAEIDWQKKMAVNAENLRKDDIDDTACDAFCAKIYKDTPYAYQSWGKIETLKKLTREQIVERHKKVFCAKNLLIAVCGNISQKILFENLQKSFGQIEVGEKICIPNFKFKGYENFANKTVKIKTKFNQGYILKGFDAPSCLDRDFVTINIINAMLGMRMTSKFFVRLREQLGLAYSVNTMYPISKNKSFFAVHIGLDKKNIKFTLSEIDKIFNDFLSKKVSQKELDETKTFLKGRRLLARQEIGAKCLALGRAEILGLGFKWDLNFDREIKKVTNADILRVAKDIFSKRSLTIVLN
ncbi:MAG: insulinase family protein [Elusimicrobiota bacterium]|jgi:predicted Zn-dependent peptidase|nr:insulinase family protein [Elusimicrobiota bacterium]